MGTRCGNLDPGVILYLFDELGMDTRAVEKLIMVCGDGGGGVCHRLSVPWWIGVA
jgi:acetate kinase